MVTGCRDRGIRQTCRTFRLRIGTHPVRTVIRHRIRHCIVFCRQTQGCGLRQVSGTPGFRAEIIRSCPGNEPIRQTGLPQEHEG